MGLFNNTRAARSGYSTERAADPESNEDCTAVRSQHAGGHIVAYCATQADAEREADKLARLRQRPGGDR